MIEEGMTSVETAGKVRRKGDAALRKQLIPQTRELKRGVKLKAQKSLSGRSVAVDRKPAAHPRRGHYGKGVRRGSEKQSPRGI